MTRCKFKCTSVTKMISWNKGDGEFLYTAKFGVVTDGSKENDVFFKYTPTGLLEIGTYTEDRFVVGENYFVDLSLENKMEGGK